MSQLRKNCVRKRCHFERSLQSTNVILQDPHLAKFLKLQNIK